MTSRSTPAITLTDFVAALAGDRSGLKVRLAGAPFKFAFDGIWSTRPTLKIEGTLAADAASLRETLRWAGLSRPLPGGGFGRFALKAQDQRGRRDHRAVRRSTSSSTAMSAEGVLTFATDGRQTLQGTLAADELDLTPYVSTVRLLTSSERDWNRVPIALDGLDRASISTCGCRRRASPSPSAKLGRTAVAANLRGGQAQRHDRRVAGVRRRAQGLVRRSPDPTAGAEFKSQLQFTDVDLEQCLGELFGSAGSRARATSRFAIEAIGRQRAGD